jgi:hypothetical protein
MSLLAEIEQGIESILMKPPYSVAPSEKHETLLALLKKEIAFAGERSPGFRNYTEHWPIPFGEAMQISDLPYLPVGVFKTNPPPALVGSDDVKRTLMSSATTGQAPSRIVLDAGTSKRMTKGVVTIVRDFIGPARRPYLVVDTPDNLAARGQMGARAAAIQGVRSFATEAVSCLRSSQSGDAVLDLERLLACASKWRGTEVLVYGFTSVIWTHLVQPLQSQGATLDMPNVHVLHSGGWKRLEQEAVTRDAFNRGVAAVFGCSTDRVIDYYGMVENVGVIYPDCEHGNKHAPAFADVIVRDPLTLAPVKAGERGLIQVCSVLPTSFPGFLLLTEDQAELLSYDHCPCGRRGTSFRFAGRVPKAEVRGCGNFESKRHGLTVGSSVG